MPIYEYYCAGCGEGISAIAFDCASRRAGALRLVRKAGAEAAFHVFLQVQLFHSPQTQAYQRQTIEVL